MLDFYAIGFAVYPTTMAEYYAAQQQQQMTQTISLEDLMGSDGAEIIDLDEQGEEVVVEEGIDSEL